MDPTVDSEQVQDRIYGSKTVVANSIQSKAFKGGGKDETGIDLVQNIGAIACIYHVYCFQRQIQPKNLNLQNNHLDIPWFGLVCLLVMVRI